MNVQERGNVIRDIFFRPLREPRDIYALAGKHRAQSTGQASHRNSAVNIVVAQGNLKRHTSASSCRESSQTIPATASRPASFEQLTLTVSSVRQEQWSHGIENHLPERLGS